MRTTRRQFCAAGAAGAAALSAPAVRAQSGWPSRTIRLMVPFAPGGGTDFAARMVAAGLAEKLGQPVVVENKPGAGSVLGTAQALAAAPDGYTLLAISGSYVVNPGIYPLSFDPINDITPVIQLTSGGYVLAVRSGLPASSLADLLALMRQRPGDLTFASSGQGGHLHVVTEYLLFRAGVQARHVPYRGTGPATADLLGGQVDMMFGGTEILMPHVATGRLRALGISTARRLARFPDLPAVAEAGMPGFDVVAWHGIIAPKGVPRPIIDTLNRHLNDLVHEGALKRKLEDHGVDSAGGPPERFGEVLKTEIERYTDVIRRAGIKAGG